MKHNENGARAEAEVVYYLRERKFKIIDRNFKTRQCEIDIIAQKNSCIYFVEVKYRTTFSQGDGFEYITPTKLKQMAFAAELWTVQNTWRGEYVLSGASVSGANFDIEFIEQI